MSEMTPLKKKTLRQNSGLLNFMSTLQHEVQALNTSQKFSKEHPQLCPMQEGTHIST